MPDKDTKDKKAKDSKEDKGKKKNGKKILIVEDERPLAHALELKFGNEGYEVTIATDGQEGLEMANNNKFHVILLDLIMPHIDGFTFMEKLQNKSPIIILSNLGQDEDRERAKKLGAVEYFVKSNTPITEIIQKVKSIIK